MTCLLVIGIIGVVCAVAPAPVAAECHQELDGQLCMIEARELDIWASYYNPPLDLPEDENDINCVHPCYLLGDGSPVVGNYGKVAACPLGMYGTVIVTDFGVVECRDSGGAVTVQYREVYRNGRGFYRDWVIVVDYLLQAPEWWVYQSWDWR